jgi:monoamine oxidase
MAMAPSLSSATTYDVIIAGAGLSGLTAACELTRQQPSAADKSSPVSILVIEARSRIGGRIHSIPLQQLDTDNQEDAGASVDNSNNNTNKSAAVSVDVGLAWIWPSRNPNVMEYMEQFNDELEYFWQYETGVTRWKWQSSTSAGCDWT